MKTYTFQVFDSKNTATKHNEEFSRVISASYAAKVKSRYGFGKVVVNNDIGFEEYERGQLTSWSYPSGMGQIKINQ